MYCSSYIYDRFVCQVDLNATVSASQDEEDSFHSCLSKCSISSSDNDVNKDGLHLPYFDPLQLSDVGSRKPNASRDFYDSGALWNPSSSQSSNYKKANAAVNIGSAGPRKPLKGDRSAANVIISDHFVNDVITMSKPNSVLNNRSSLQSSNYRKANATVSERFTGSGKPLMKDDSSAANRIISDHLMDDFTATSKPNAALNNRSSLQGSNNRKTDTAVNNRSACPRKPSMKDGSSAANGIISYHLMDDVTAKSKPNTVLNNLSSLQSSNNRKEDIAVNNRSACPRKPLMKDDSCTANGIISDNLIGDVTATSKPNTVLNNRSSLQSSNNRKTNTAVDNRSASRGEHLVKGDSSAANRNISNHLMDDVTARLETESLLNKTFNIGSDGGSSGQSWLTSDLTYVTSLSDSSCSLHSVRIERQPVASDVVGDKRHCSLVETVLVPVDDIDADTSCQHDDLECSYLSDDRSLLHDWKKTSDNDVDVTVPAEVKALSAAELRRRLTELGQNPGPITESTRRLHELRLSRLMARSDKHATTAAEPHLVNTG